MANALSYYAFRDQNMLTPEQLAAQPGLSPDEAIRRIALTPGATFRPGEFEALTRLAQNALMQQGNRDQINQFYDSPDRANDIEMAVQPGQDQAFMQLTDSLRGASQQGAFARARSGNMGGSVQARQQTQLAGQGAAQGAQLAAGFEGQRDSLRAALEAARVGEISGSYQLDPALQASLGQRVNTYGVQGDTNTALEALRQQQTGMTNFNNDEFSRGLGNMVNIGTNAYGATQNQGMAADYQAFLQSLRQRQMASMTGNTMGAGGTY